MDMKRQAIAGLSLRGNGQAGKVMGLNKALRSVPELGIKVGGFCYLERESTPHFLDFVTNRVASLLVAFP